MVQTSLSSGRADDLHSTTGAIADGLGAQNITFEGIECAKVQKSSEVYKKFGPPSEELMQSVATYVSRTSREPLDRDDGFTWPKGAAHHLS